MKEEYDLIVIGAGFYGLTIARLAAEKLNLNVLVMEKRDHIGGNAWSEVDETTGIEVHKYGTHIFHSSNQNVWNFVTQFSEFNNYQHTVWTVHNGKKYSLPINLSTINSFYNKNFSPFEAETFISSLGKSKQPPKNFEEKIISKIGQDLYEAFYKGYTQKQWETDPDKLPSELASRLPIRFNYNSRYFKDIFEGIPKLGYYGLLNSLSNHPLINIKLNLDFFEVQKEINPNILKVYTGPIDKYFNYALGALGWRTLDFEYEWHQINDFQGSAVVNYSDKDIPYTRIHEFKHLAPEKYNESLGTVISREFSRFAEKSDDPYYPINSPKDRVNYESYRELAKNEKNLIFGGRLGTYKYLDMDMAIASAISCFNNEILSHFGKI